MTLGYWGICHGVKLATCDVKTFLEKSEITLPIPLYALVQYFVRETRIHYTYTLSPTARSAILADDRGTVDARD